MRFRLRTLLIVVGLTGIVFAGLERLTWRSQKDVRVMTKILPRGALSERDMDRWLLDRGFRPVREVPEGTFAYRPAAGSERRRYIGSFEGSLPFYVHFDFDRPGGDSFGLMMQVSSGSPGRFWEVRRTRSGLARFLSAFGAWCDAMAYGRPAPGAPDV